VLRQARDLEGFKGGVALVDRDRGSVFSFTLWESEEAMRASEEAGNRLRGQAASDLEFRTPVVERYEVGVLEID
jgi:heme-degrading monooxygenase HmoA